MGRDAAFVLSPREVPQPFAHCAKARDQIGAFPAQEVRKGANARFFKRGLGGLVPPPQIILTGLSRRKSSVSALPITENPRGLLRSEATLARNLLWLKPD